MTTYTLTGFSQGYNDYGDPTNAQASTMQIVTLDGTLTQYSILEEFESGLPVVDFMDTAGGVVEFRVDGGYFETEIETYAGSVTWSGGTTDVIVFWDLTNDIDYIYQINGAEFPNDLISIDSSITYVGRTQTGPFTPNTPFTLDDASLVTSTGNDRMNGTEFADMFAGGAGNDVLIGDLGNDTLNGGDGNDTLNGGDGDDQIIGGLSTADLRDVIYAGAGNDNVDGGYGNDLVYGQDGDDVIAGGFGSDELQGQNGNDVITGSALSDLVFGGAGNDFVNGGFGHDRINGGTGADKFYHLGIRDHGSDWVQDFTNAEGDVLLFGNANASASDFQINYNHTANAAGERSGDDNVQEAFVIYKPTGQIIWALVDGAGESSIQIDIGGTVTDLVV